MFAPLHRQVDPDLYPAGTQLESEGSAVAWTAVLAGAATAIATWLVLFTLGVGLGLAETSSWPGAHASPSSFRVVAGLWLIVTQWLSFALGGYIAGRLRVRWARLHSDEVFFRDTAHGLLTWAISTVVVAGIALLATSLARPEMTTDPDLSSAAVEQMQKAAAASAIFTAISMLVGAFVAAVAAVIGGHLRDRHP
jgi:hypothetical protein